MTLWEGGSEPAQPSSWPAPVGPGSSGPTSSIYQSAVASAPVVYGSADPTWPAYQPPVVVRRPRWVVPVLAVMGAVTLAALTVASWALAQRGGGGATGGDAAVAGPTLQEAHESCGSKGNLADGGRTLDLDMKGEDFGSGQLTWSEVRCYLNALETPAYVVRHMESTRALDGRQSDAWGNFEASWTYHPDDGLDVLIRQLG